ncbi:helix-turn-helix domain-containing protein [Roseovarius amoyensis]|uniref:helix-turn-helix domain-containing protein n=1 Tax=Roseovarius amoyensis TaxID=2211448 RepID=UPI000DBE0E57|nr:helix-turn-helix domain-containing protein [Roseovarius amoyensis]
MSDDSGKGRPPAPVTGSAGRALLVLRLVLEHGPVSPQRLTELSGLSRTAVHRAIHALIEGGFVRYQLGKMHVIGTAGMRDRVQGAFFSPPGIDAISRAVDAALKGRRTQCDIAVLPRDGEVALVETTAPGEIPETDFFESDLVSVLLAHFEPVDVTRITARTLRDTGGAARVGSEFLDRYRQAHYQGYLWNGPEGTLCVRLNTEPERAVAIRLFARGTARLRQRDCVEIVREMGHTLPEMFPNLATITN